MDENLIVQRSMGELRRAASSGKAYYSCERFEDPFGRLVVGIGARLKGRALRYVVGSGRKAVCVSPVALQDGMVLQAALRRLERQRPETPLPGQVPRVSRILAVDGDEAILGLVIEALKINGYEVSAARSGREALLMVKRRTPDLVLSDLQMPGMDGRALFRALRAHDPGLPFVVMTDDRTDQDAPTEFDGVIYKPFRIQELAWFVKRVLSAPQDANPGIGEQGD